MPHIKILTSLTPLTSKQNPQIFTSLTNFTSLTSNYSNYVKLRQSTAITAQISTYELHNLRQSYSKQISINKTMSTISKTRMSKHGISRHIQNNNTHYTLMI